VSKRRTKYSKQQSGVVDSLSQAVEALKGGDVIVFPTETFYGLGADAFDHSAVEKVVSLKGRSPESPIAVIIGDEKALESIVTEIPPEARKLIEHFWPGPLTLILPAKQGLPQALLNPRGGIGVRISGHPLATRLTREFGRPLTATSANPTGKKPARTLTEARAYFSNHIEVFVDGGKLGGKRGSTVAEVVGNQLRIIREGEIDSEKLEEVLPGGLVR
jgi:L-threonylcarbamoyladenylate synthase